MIVDCVKLTVKMKHHTVHRFQNIEPGLWLWLALGNWCPLDHYYYERKSFDWTEDNGSQFLIIPFPMEVPSESLVGRWGSRTPPSTLVTSPQVPVLPGGSSQCDLWRHHAASEARAVCQHEFQGCQSAGSSKVNLVMVAAWPRAAHSPLIWHRPIISKGNDKEFSRTRQRTRNKGTFHKAWWSEFSPGTHKMNRENQLPPLSSDLYICVHTCTHKSTYE